MPVWVATHAKESPGSFFQHRFPNLDSDPLFYANYSAIGRNVKSSNAHTTYSAGGRQMVIRHPPAKRKATRRSYPCNPSQVLPVDQSVRLNEYCYLPLTR